ncbi:MAG: UbiA prenyltransferase family protein [Lachnospiraceae bacterium]|nr:UbiA prenyltransferase family protein [Lachnospiraceae bacterium]
MKLRFVLQAMRIKNWIKNSLIFIPIIFSGVLFEDDNLFIVLGAFLSFSLIASSIYIINDVRDAENDRKHAPKCSRPIAAGNLAAGKALLISGIIAGGGYSLAFWIGKTTGFVFWPLFELTAYFLLNLGYSMGLKNFPLIDVFLLALGFMLRVFYGGSILGIGVSNWVYLTIFSGALYLSLGKRKNELLYYGDAARESLKNYTLEFLDKGMQIFLTLCLVFYSLACASYDTAAAKMGVNLIWTVPLVTLICLKYYLDISRMTEGDPVGIIFKDKYLLLLITAYGLSMIILLN